MKLEINEQKQDNQWTFLSNHSHVLICLAKNPESLLREVAIKIGITERAVQRIVSDLEKAEIVSKKKSGRRNIYSINTNKKLRHPIEAHCSIEELLTMILKNESKQLSI